MKPDFQKLEATRKAIEKSVERKFNQGRRTGVYLLPSGLTAIGLFFGFFSIIQSMKGLFNLDHDYSLAAYSIIIASFIDALDGRLARLMHAESKFGFQFDSIADVVSFGVAPSVLIYCSALEPLDRWGLLGSFAFLACAALRLARFNVLSEENPSGRKYFKGMSSPVAAGGLALSALIPIPSFGYSKEITLLLWTIFLAALMVSNIRFRSFKQMDMASRRPVSTFLFFLSLAVLVFAFQEFALLGMFVIYLAWGLSEEASLFKRRRKSDPRTPWLPFGDRGN